MDLCSGIGGGRLGLEKNGFICVGFSEILKSSIKNYKLFYNTSNEKELGDLTKLTSDKIPDAEILVSGFPCQTFSIQGLRASFNDKRGLIIFYIINILKEKNIKYFILENVKGLVNHNNGKTLKTIIKLLENIGYNIYYKTLKSSDYGLPQKRERIYFVGIRRDLKYHDFIFPLAFKEKSNLSDFLIDNDERYIYKNYEWFTNYINNKYNFGKYNISNILKEDFLIVDIRQSDLRLFREYIPTLRSGRSGILYVKNGILRRISGRESLLLQGFGKIIFDKAKDLNDTTLLQQTGNAMSVNVIYEIGNSLKTVMKKNGDM